MIFKDNAPLYATEIERKQGEDVLYVNFLRAPFAPSIAENPAIMANVVDLLAENPSISRIVFVQQRNFHYPYEQVALLAEVAQIYHYLTKQEALLSLQKLRLFGDPAGTHDELSSLLLLLRQDPVLCALKLRRRINDLKKEQDKGNLSVLGYNQYVRVLEKFSELLEQTKLLHLMKEKLGDVSAIDRTAYKILFRPDILPNFTFTRLVSQFPEGSEMIDQYTLVSDVEQTTVTILKRKDDAKYFYHLLPPEYTLSEEHHLLLQLARNVLIEHRPKAEEFTDPEKTRLVFFNVARDLLTELSQHKGTALTYRELTTLARILVRYTVGFGLIEVLLMDQQLQDIVLNAPIAQNSIFVRHQKYEECVTNILPSYEDADSWAAKLRLQSGRPLDEANPVLDTDLVFPQARARVAAVKEPLSPAGLAYAIRRHRDNPWTLPLFINNRMINSFAAGLLSFLVHGNRTLLVAGTRSSGKTSFLGSLMLEVLPKIRTIVIEDTLELSVDVMRKIGYDILRMKVRSALVEGTTEIEAAEGIRTSLRLGDSALIVGEVRSSILGDEEVLIIDKGITKRIPIKDLEGKEIKDIYIPSMDADLKVRLRKLLAFVKHPKRNRLLRVKTRTGREITVTPDHSLFTSHNFKIYPIECEDLKIGNKIILSSRLPCGYNNLDSINLLDELFELRVVNFEEPVRKAIAKLGWKKATEICNIKCGDIYNYYRSNQKTNIPINSFMNLMRESKTDFSSDQLLVKTGTSTTIPAILPINEDFCHWIGYYISEGYYADKEGGRVVITNSDERVLNHIDSLSQKLFNITPDRREVHGIGHSVQLGISCKPLASLISKLGCGRTCTEKRVPQFIYGLSKNKIAAFLRALYEGDGSMTVSKSSGNSIRYHTTSKKLAEDVVYLLLVFGIVARVYSKDVLVGNRIWIVEFKDRKMVETFIEEVGFIFKGKNILAHSFPHTKSDSVCFDKKVLKENLIRYPRKYRHLFRFLRCGKSYLRKIVNDPECEVSNKLKFYAEGDFYIDEVKEIEEIYLKEGEYVYDLSVEPGQNFIGGFGGILLHNTEAKALYEAMRVGALANVVAGTIHGDSPYGVFDRVVNDLGVQATSFKATDIIIIANPVKTPDGLHSSKRIMSVTEVRKHWVKDPLQEGGFVDLLRYNVDKDELEPTQELMNGDSEIIKSIAGNVKGWAGNWDAVYDNILLRGKIKQELVFLAEKLRKPELLEAPFVCLANTVFHRISDEVREEHGLPLSARVFPLWKQWLYEKAGKL